MVRFVPVVALLLSGVPAAAQPVDELTGLWRNRSNSVHIELYACGSAPCARVAWASPTATAKAARRGTNTLVGTELFRGFRRDREGRWAGRVFVPDLAVTLRATFQLDGSDTLVGRGCLLGRVGCRTKTYTRIR